MSPMESPHSMRGPSPEASGEALGPEGDDSNMGTAPTSGPEATSSQGIPARIRATDLGEFWTDRNDDKYEDDVLLCCVDPEGSESEAVQPESAAMALMEEMARRYNAHDELLNALRAIANLETDIGDSHRYRYAALARIAIAKVQP